MNNVYTNLINQIKKEFANCLKAENIVNLSVCNYCGLTNVKSYEFFQFNHKCVNCENKANHSISFMDDYNINKGAQSTKIEFAEHNGLIRILANGKKYVIANLVIPNESVKELCLYSDENTIFDLISHITNWGGIYNPNPTISKTLFDWLINNFTISQ